MAGALRRNSLRQSLYTCVRPSNAPYKYIFIYSTFPHSSSAGRLQICCCKLYILAGCWLHQLRLPASHRNQPIKTVPKWGTIHFICIGLSVYTITGEHIISRPGRYVCWRYRWARDKSFFTHHDSNHSRTILPGSRGSGIPIIISSLAFRPITIRLSSSPERFSSN